MASRAWAVWSWDDRNKVWLAVAEGTQRDMRKALDRKQSAAGRLMPSARFTVTPLSQPPAEPPEDQEA